MSLRRRTYMGESKSQDIPKNVDGKIIGFFRKNKVDVFRALKNKNPQLWNSGEKSYFSGRIKVHGEHVLHQIMEGLLRLKKEFPVGSNGHEQAKVLYNVVLAVWKKFD